jgi:hypothetical protein
MSFALLRGLNAFTRPCLVQGILEADLFTVFPTFNPDGNKAWQIVEKEREIELPPGFINY